MPEFLYRYRPATALLDVFHELEREQIYFAPLADLNDPMEGHRDLVWRGDEIVWRNLLKHYVRSLAAGYSLLGAWTDDFTAEACFDLIYAVEPQPPEAPVKAFYADAAAKLFARPIATDLARGLAERDAGVRRNELTFILRIFHVVALDCVQAANRARGAPSPIADLPAGAADAAAANLHRFLAHPAVPPPLGEALYGGAEKTAMEFRLLNGVTGGAAAGLPAQVPFLVADFPKHYVENLPRLLYPDWFVASFVEDPSNAAMWGAYADSHRGCCLKFRTGGTPEHPVLDLFRTASMTGGKEGPQQHKDWRAMAFREVVYPLEFPEVEFFNSFGVIPHGHLEDYWFSDGAGGRSRVAERMQQDTDAWRQAYWAVFDTCCNTKTPDWSHEREHRLVLNSMLWRFDTVEFRQLRYRFSDLAGIVFGVRTSDADKMRIAKVIEAKCDAAGRTDFEFLQAEFEPTRGAMKLSPLGMLKIALPAR